nr:hypothetical protein [Sphingopyxis sp. MWB1]
MLFNRLGAEPEFGGDLRIGHAAQPVHQEDTPRPRGHGEQHGPKGAPQIDRFDPSFLLGRYGCIAAFVERTGGASLTHNFARALDQQIVGDARQIGARICDPIERAAAKQPREGFLHKIGRGIAPDPPAEIMEQPPSLGAIEGREIDPPTGRGKRFRPFANVGRVLAPKTCLAHHFAATAARQSVSARII